MPKKHLFLASAIILFALTKPTFSVDNTEEMDPALQTALAVLPVMVNSLLEMGKNSESAKDPRIVTTTIVTLFTGMCTILSKLFRARIISPTELEEILLSEYEQIRTMQATPSSSLESNAFYEMIHLIIASAQK